MPTNSFLLLCQTLPTALMPQASTKKTSEMTYKIEIPRKNIFEPKNQALGQEKNNQTPKNYEVHFPNPFSSSFLSPFFRKLSPIIIKVLLIINSVTKPLTNCRQSSKSVANHPKSVAKQNSDLNIADGEICLGVTNL